MSSVEETEGELHTMCSSKKFIEIVKDLSTKQQECIKDMGFGVLLNIKCLAFRLPLYEILLKANAPETKEIVLHGKWIPVRESDFEKVMGLPNDSHDVDYNMGEFDEICIRMKNLLINTSKHAITLPSLMPSLMTKHNTCIRSIAATVGITFAFFSLLLLRCFSSLGCL
ncbi:hypothetical protein Dsin_012070 [Dipteronia sinensis]|uniref:Uncharacterized protein n=1 Tax=Dipteronia sinensis TaxID=43782 RepID=A0AAE0AI81_9ROSI|nr:hypothetical protein Dsin_012070 [Dipteronia sinensis]